MKREINITTWESTFQFKIDFIGNNSDTIYVLCQLPSGNNKAKFCLIIPFLLNNSFVTDV